MFFRQGQASFVCDSVIRDDDDAALQEELYRDAIAETVVDVLHGFNGTFFAYGQVSLLNFFLI